MAAMSEAAAALGYITTASETDQGRDTPERQVVTDDSPHQIALGCCRLTAVHRAIGRTGRRGSSRTFFEPTCKLQDTAKEGAMKPGVAWRRRMRVAANGDDA